MRKRDNHHLSVDVVELAFSFFFFLDKEYSGVRKTTAAAILKTVYVAKMKKNNSKPNIQVEGKQ